MKVERYCICGNGMKVEVRERDYPKVEAAWKQVHSGPHHRDCTAAEAHRMRKLAEAIAGCYRSIDRFYSVLGKDTPDEGQNQHYEETRHEG